MLRLLLRHFCFFPLTLRPLTATDSGLAMVMAMATVRPYIATIHRSHFRLAIHITVTLITALTITGHTMDTDTAAMDTDTAAMDMAAMVIDTGMDIAGTTTVDITDTGIRYKSNTIPITTDTVPGVTTDIVRAATDPAAIGHPGTDRAAITEVVRAGTNQSAGDNIRKIQSTKVRGA